MARIQPIDPATATGEAAEILAGVKAKMGMVPNLVSTMANAPAVANSYLGFSGALAAGDLPADLRERISLAVGQSNECQYCLSAHTLLGKNAGLSPEEIERSRRGDAGDDKQRAAVAFARKLADNRGVVSDAEVQAVRDAGYTDGEIGEIVANVALNIFTNYYNHVADPEIDFPIAEPLAA